MSYVYIIGHPGGFVKIGHSKDPYGRLKDLQAGCPKDLWIVGMIEVPGPERLEEHLHRRFAEKNLRGEWFKDLGQEGWEYVRYFMQMDPAALNEELEYRNINRRRIA